MTEKQLQDFLDKGGKIQHCPTGARTEEVSYKSFYGRKKTKKEAEE